MKYTRFSFAVLFAASLSFVACDTSRTNERAGEVGEEGAEFVEELGPDRESAGEVAVPMQMTTPEETLTAVESAGGLLKLSPDAAVSNIDKWIGSLTAHPYVDDSDDIVEDLNKLKMLLMQSPIDGEEVGEVLDELSDETEEAADDANSTSVRMLAQALEAAAEALGE